MGRRTLARVVPQMKHIIASIMSKLISTLRLIAAKRAEGPGKAECPRGLAAARSEWQLGFSTGNKRGREGGDGRHGDTLACSDAGDVNKLQSGWRCDNLGQEELLQFAQHNRRRSACGFDTVKINYVIVKGKHTNNELSKPHNNTIPVTA